MSENTIVMLGPVTAFMLCLGAYIFARIIGARQRSKVYLAHHYVINMVEVSEGIYYPEKEAKR